jgi:hypothetical protein
MFMFIYQPIVILVHPKFPNCTIILNTNTSSAIVCIWGAETYICGKLKIVMLSTYALILTTIVNASAKH